MKLTNKTLLLTLAVLVTLLAAITMFDYADSADSAPEVRAYDMAASHTAKKRYQHMHGMKNKEQDSPEKYAALHHSMRVGPQGQSYPKGALFSEAGLMRLRAAQVRTGYDDLPWENHGPYNVAGLSRNILIDPSDPTKSTWIVGTAGGGIWKTTDAGLSWEWLSSELTNMSSGVLTWSESNTDIIYAGTGQGWYSSFDITGTGIWKSLDGGNNWTLIESTTTVEDFGNITSIWAHPSDPNTVIATTVPPSTLDERSDGTAPISTIVKSTDGGATWTVKESQQIFLQRGRIQHLVVDPTNPDVMYASVNGRGVLKSTDGGETWSLKNTGITNVLRIELAIAPSNTDLIYASCQTGDDNSILYVSEDAGETWISGVHAGDNQPQNWLTQGWFANAVAVHPTIPTEFYVGGLDVHRGNLDLSGFVTSDPNITSVEENGTASFLSFVSFTDISFTNGTVGIDVANKDGAGNLNAIDLSDITSVEVRFGPGISQMAHRFTVGIDPETGEPFNAGVQPSGYSYQDYVEVPFQVWDIDNNRQLMVSFRDQQQDGVFNLNDGTEEARAISREYVFIHSLDYAETANEDISRTGGHTFSQMYNYWPLLTEGATWTPEALPESQLVINWGQVTQRGFEMVPLTDGFADFDAPTYVHVDQHNIYIEEDPDQPGNYWIINSNDGGVSISRDLGTTWDQLTNGMISTQYYGVSKRRGELQFIGGMQDNSTWISPDGEDATSNTLYTEVWPADGFETAWNYKNNQQLLSSAQFNQIGRSSDGGESWTFVTGGLDDVGSLPGVPFATRIASHQVDASHVAFIGPSGVWNSQDFGANWQLTPITEKFFCCSQGAADVEISLANHRIMWAGSGMRTPSAFAPEGEAMQVSVDGGETFTPTAIYDGEETAGISGIATHPWLDSTAFVMFSQYDSPKLLRTDDLGQSWRDISGFEGTPFGSNNGFPNCAVYDLLVLPSDTSVFFAATELGVMVSTNSGETWAPMGGAVSRMPAWEISVVDDRVLLATHGRGIWSVALPELLYTPFINRITFRQGGLLAVSFNVYQPTDAIDVIINGEVVSQLTNVERGIRTVEIDAVLGVDQLVSLAATHEGTRYESYKDFFAKELLVSNSNTLTDRSVRLGPNPVTAGRLNLFFGAEGEFNGQALRQLSIFDLNGREVHSEYLTAGLEHSVDVAHLRAGVYLVQVAAADRTYSTRLSIQ